MTNSRVRLAAGYVLPRSEAENGDAKNGPRCLLSDLPPEMCGLACHRNSDPIGILDDLPDVWDEAA